MSPLTEAVPLAAVEDVYRASYRRFLRVALAMLGDRALADDAVQETFARAVRSRAGLRDVSRLEAWLWSTLTNICRDEWRRSARSSASLEATEVSANGSPPEYRELRAAIAVLPARQRTMLFLRHYADLDYQRIADALGITNHVSLRFGNQGCGRGGELRRRVTDKRVLRLIRQFLGAGIMRHGSLTATPSGTPQGAILSPLLANVALSILDRRFEDAWNACTPHQRKWRMAKGHPSYRMIRYADDFVILVRGTETQAEAIKQQTAEFMREQMRLTLSPEKTRITHVDDGFDFLGFRIQRRPRGRALVAYSFPSERSFREIKHRIKELTGRSTIGLSLDQLVHALNPILRGFTNYHRHAASKRCFSYLDHYLWWRMMLWLRKKHPRLTWKQIKRRYWGRNWTSPDGTRLYWPGRVPVSRYRYRGHRIPTPWAIPDESRATTRTGASVSSCK